MAAAHTKILGLTDRVLAVGGDNGGRAMCI